MAASLLKPLVIAIVGAAAWYNWRALRRAGSGPADPPRALPEIPTDAPKVSVLVAAWNEARMIERHVRSFEALTYRPREMVLCAGGTDGTYEIAKRLVDDDVVVLRQHPGEGKQRALHRCLAASDGEIIMLTDADCVLADAPFRRLIDPIARGDAHVATGYRAPLREQRGRDFVRFQWFSEAASQGIRQQVNGLWGGNCAFRRTMAERAGALSMPAATGTDYVQGRTFISAGCGIRWIPDSQIQTRYPTEVRTYLRVSRRWIKNILVHGPRFGDWRSVAEILVAICIASSTLVPILLAPVTGRTALAAPLTLLSVSTMNRVRRIAVGAHLTGSRAGWRLFAATPVFALLDQLAALGAAYDVLSRRGRTRW